MLISNAFAQAAATGAAASGVDPQQVNALGSLMPLFLILIIFYMMIIRPQQKKYKKHNEMVNAIKKGDRVLLGGGIIGSVSKVDADGFLHVEIASGVTVKVVRDTVVNVTSQGGSAEGGDKMLAGYTTPAKSANDNATKKTANDN